MIKKVEHYIGARHVGKTGEAIGMFSLLSNKTPNSYICTPTLPMKKLLEKRLPAYHSKKSPIYSMSELIKDFNYLERGAKEGEIIHIVCDEFLSTDLDLKVKFYELVMNSFYLYKLYTFTTCDRLYSQSLLNWAEFIHKEQKTPKESSPLELREHFYSLLSYSFSVIQPLSTNQVLKMNHMWIKELKNVATDTNYIEQFLRERLGLCIVIDC